MVFSASMSKSRADGTLMVRSFKLVARVLYNNALDLRYGRPLAGEIPTRFEHLGATNTDNSDNLVLDRIFAGRIRSDDVLVDVGCGKGRVINWWLRKGYRNQIYGLELDEVVAERTRRRLRRFGNVTVITGHAVQTAPAQGTLFYLFNPFHAEVVGKFAERLTEFGMKGRPIRIIYNHCLHLGPFLESDLWEVTILGRQQSGTPSHQVAYVEFVGGPTAQ
jgi:hypothetical protein